MLARFYGFASVIRDASFVAYAEISNGKGFDDYDELLFELLFEPVSSRLNRVPKQ